LAIGLSKSLHKFSAFREWLFSGRHFGHRAVEKPPQIFRISGVVVFGTQI